MALTSEEALRAYAKMINTLNSDCFAPLLADQFVYESQRVFAPLDSKAAFLEYINGKLKTLRHSDGRVFAEMGTVFVYGKNQPCVVLAQPSAENLVALVLAEVAGDKLYRIDLCIVPSPHSAARSGVYPS